MDKVVLVTGSSQGIGLAIVKTYLKNGYSVASCSELDFEQCPECQTLKQQYQDKYLYVKADITDLNAIDNLVKTVISTFKRLDILVSNAGKNVFKGVDCSVADFEFNFNLNLRSHWYVAKACKPYLEEHNGVILVMSSNHAFSSMPMCAPYNISKRALLSLVQSITMEWAPKIRAVGIAPGFIDTIGNQAWFNSHEDPEKARQDTVKIHPVKRIGTPEEVGELCLFYQVIKQDLLQVLLF